MTGDLRFSGLNKRGGVGRKSLAQKGGLPLCCRFQYRTGRCHKNYVGVQDIFHLGWKGDKQKRKGRMELGVLWNVFLFSLLNVFADASPASSVESGTSGG